MLADEPIDPSPVACFDAANINEVQLVIRESDSFTVRSVSVWGSVDLGSLGSPKTEDYVK